MNHITRTLVLSVAVFCSTLTIAQVTIMPAPSGPNYPGASIKIVSPKPNEVLKSDTLGVVVDLKGFEIATPTPGDDKKGLAYSKADPAKPDVMYGQHVHVIVDNEPYMACFVKGKPFIIPKALSPGMHTLRVFPSRSWHESVKQKGCFAMETFYVKEKTGTPVNWTKPFLTYSRPKSDYSGDGAKQILVDFYVSNCALGKGKYSADISVDGATPYSAIDWRPYVINGLTVGQHKVKVTLKDPAGKPVEGAWNSTERTITLK